MRRCLIIVAQLCSASPLAAQSKQAIERANPYKNLFKPPGLEQAARQQRARQLVQAAAEAAKPRVVCGMTLIPAPNVDPRMVLEPKTDDTRYTIRAIEPPICWQR